AVLVFASHISRKGYGDRGYGAQESLYVSPHVACVGTICTSRVQYDRASRRPRAPRAPGLRLDSVLRQDPPPHRASQRRDGNRHDLSRREDESRPLQLDGPRRREPSGPGRARAFDQLRDPHPGSDSLSQFQFQGHHLRLRDAVRQRALGRLDRFRRQRPPRRASRGDSRTDRHRGADQLRRQEPDHDRRLHERQSSDRDPGGVAVMRKSTAGSRQSTVRAAERGPTLIEMLLALALLGVVLLGITPLCVGRVKSNFSGNEYTSINVLARDRLERLMNMPFTSPDLSPGDHCTSDLAATLPDPKTGLPGTVPNPFTLTYTVLQYQIPGACPTCGPAPAVNASFTPTEVKNAGAVFQYKRIDVTVTSGTGPLGIGTRASRVSGVISNPNPDTILSGDFVACGS